MASIMTRSNVVGAVRALPPPIRAGGGLCFERLLVAPHPPKSDVDTARVARLNALDDALAPSPLGGRPMSTLGDVRSTLEAALRFGPRPMHEAIRRLLSSLPKDGEIVTAEELARAMHDELCEWKVHTPVCLSNWRARAATVLAEAREGPQ
jgi:hypothetical protein